jgi:DNA-binding NarL/FixJ family response regulator
VTRAGLEALAASSPELRVVGSFADLSGVAAAGADVILAAMRVDELPGENGGPRLVLLTNEAQPVWTAEALRHGVRALLPRNVSQVEILAAVEAAARDFAVIDPHELEGLLGVPTTAAVLEEGGVALTARELEVLRMMADGAANKIIAWKLGISEHTVKFHVASILAKLGASSRTEAATLGIRRGLVLL